MHQPEKRKVMKVVQMFLYHYELMMMIVISS